MASNTATASSVRQPSAQNGPESIARDYWENELELDITDALRRAEDPGQRGTWLDSRTRRQTNVLCQVLGVDGGRRFKDKRAALARCDGQLTPFCLIDHFARFKGKFTVADLAANTLSPDTLDLCRCKNEGTYDTIALMYALFNADPDNLRKLFHLDKIHKSGFARMALKQKVRQPDKSFEEFLKPKQANQILEAFDKQQRDLRQSQLKNIVRHNHHHLVFIRRPERHQYIIREGRIAHGHRVEWIILDFADNARRVNISSNSNEVPLQIANALASAYFGKDVQYDNECEITYEKQIQNLFDQLKAGNCEGLQLVDIDVHGSPLHGADLRLAHDDPDVVQRAIAALERDHSSLTAHIGRIAKVKLIYLDKRIDIKFEQLAPNGDEYIVRYMDHRLNASMRKRFEDFMRDTHGIPILSTEKRFARNA